MTKPTKIVVLVVAGMLVLGSLPMMSGCLHAYHERSKVSIGMSVADVFNVIDEWNFCLSSYLDADTKEFGMFNILKEPDEATYRVPQDDKTISSKDEPGEDWFFDYEKQRMIKGVELLPPHSHPENQPAPGPAGRVPANWESHLN